jgi:hypothetical protein
MMPFTPNKKKSPDRNSKPHLAKKKTALSPRKFSLSKVLSKKGT